MTTIDELLQKHPTPWEMRVMTCGESAGDQWACDANGEKVFCIADVYSEDAQALLDAMSELVRLRVETQAGARNYNDLRNFSDGLMLACDGLRSRIAEQDAELATLREERKKNVKRIFELHESLRSSHQTIVACRTQDAELIELRAFRERMKDAPKRLADYAQAAIGCRHGDCIVADDIASGLRSGALDAVVFGEGGPP